MSSLWAVLELQQGHAAAARTASSSVCLRLCVHLEVQRVSRRVLWFGSAVQRPPSAAESRVSDPLGRGSAQRGSALSEWKSMGSFQGGWKVNKTKQRGEKEQFWDTEHHVSTRHWPGIILDPYKRDHSINQLNLTLHIWYTHKVVIVKNTNKMQ